MSKAVILNNSSGQDKDTKDFYKYPLTSFLAWINVI